MVAKGNTEKEGKERLGRNGSKEIIEDVGSSTGRMQACQISKEQEFTVICEVGVSGILRQVSCILQAADCCLMTIESGKWKVEGYYTL